MRKNKLDPNSNMRWNMKIILPEHQEAIEKHYRDKKKIAKPILDEQQYEDINRTLYQAMYDNLTCKVSVYTDGFINVLEGGITHFDYVLKRIKLEFNEEVHWVKVCDIVDIIVT